MFRLAFAGAACVWALGCGSDSSDPSGSTGTGGSGGSSGVGAASGAAGDAGDCDPHHPPGTGGSSSGSSGGASAEGGVIVLDGGNIDLDSGSDPPVGYLKCYDANTGAGFMCEQYGMVCCEKKDDCWDPATDPTFCDRPWCPND